MSSVFDGDWHRLEFKATIAVLVFVLAPLPVTLLIMLVAAAGPVPVLITTGIWLASAALIAAAGFYEWHFSRYRITAERFEFRRGGIFRSHRSIPRERIRAVDLTANPIERVLRITKVNVSTGDQGSEGAIRLDAIDRAAAEELRQTLILRDRAAAERTDGLLAKLNPMWLGYSALTLSLVLVVWGALGSVIGNVQELLRTWGVWTAVGEVFLALGLVLFALVAVAAAILVGVVGAVLLSAEMWWDYRLTREPGGTLRVTRGLLTTRSLSLEERRLRGVELSEPLLLRWFRGARLNAVATGLNSAQRSGDQQKQPERKTLLPPAPRSEALRVAWMVLRRNPFEARLRGHTRRALRRRINWALFAAIPVLLAFSVLAWLDWIPGWLVVFAVVLAVLVGIGFAIDAYRNLGHRLDEEYLLARHGTGLRKTVALQRDDIIGWRISRTVFQRRAGLMTVGATTAAGSYVYRVHDVDTETGLAVADEAVPGLIAPFLRRD